MGVDLSSKMLEHAETAAAQQDITNARFTCADFNDIQPEDKFDLTVHTTIATMGWCMDE